MRLLKVTLFNFCQFDKLSYDLIDGITRIYAPNGRGKTNFLRGLVYGLTGWCDPSWGTQSDLQKDDAASPGYVQIELEIEGSIYKLQRYVIVTPKTADSISCEDPKLYIEKRQRVNAFLESKLPVTLPILAQLMWLRQSNLHWLLTATTASINTFLGLIFDTRKLEKLRDVLKLVAAKVADIRGDQDPKIEYWKGVLAQMPDIEGLERDLKELNEKYVELASYSGKRILRKSTYEKLCADYQKQIDDQQKVICKLSGELEEILNVLPNPLPDVAKLRIILSKEKEKLDSYVNVLKELTNKQDDMQKHLELLTEADSGKCAYCGSTFKNNDEHKRAVLNRLGYSEEFSYDQVIEVLKHSLSNCKTQIEDHKQLISEIDIQALETDISNALDMQTLKAEYNKREVVLQKEETKLNLTKAQLEDVKQSIVIPDNEQPVDEQIKNLKETLATVQQAYTDAKTNKQLAESSIKQLEQEKKEHEKNSFVKKLLVNSREVLSQSRAQARYISGKLDTLNSYIEHYLALSEMPFTLRLDKQEHTFKFRMQGSDQDHPAGMLSGAQAAAAAIAIQMALVETAYPELSILLVDEADAALSPENKFIAARLYRTLSNSIDGTVLVISQSDDVADDCDNVWELQ